METTIFKKILQIRNLLVLVAPLILAFGLLAECYLANDHFQRSGSALVILALLIFLVKIPFINNLSQNNINRIKHAQLPINEIKRKSSVALKPAVKELENVINMVSDKIEEQTDSDKAALDTINYTEVLIACIGTFVWGYGDIVIKMSGFSNIAKCAT